MILSQQHIVATPKGATELSLEDKTEFMPQLPQWKMVWVDNVEQLYRSYPLKNFTAAIDFANKVSLVSEQCDHHPRLSVESGQSCPYIGGATALVACILTTSSWRRKLMRFITLYDF